MKDGLTLKLPVTSEVNTCALHVHLIILLSELFLYVQQRVMFKTSDFSNIQYKLVELALRSKDKNVYQPELSKSSKDKDDENISNLDKYSTDDAMVANAQASDSEHEHLQKKFWHKQFYLLLFLYDLKSIMLELHQYFPLCY
ncbi:hypothetical protein CIHG_10308 [Coccidioides immitis H538.4]|uniref:Uncharacterized protein n=1 Tax=Coccidioides immitis H538.4 TaxID=396776 RepID=A0A0J8S4S1_COCIT|nr:hypothetical protein CIHG_10308 [Coccidioides immitis H538.4]